MNAYDTFREMMVEAQRISAAADTHAEGMAEFLSAPGRLRRVSPHELKKLKRELRSFDMVTGKWKR